MVSEIVHVNVPYTPWKNAPPRKVALTAEGPSPAEMHIPVGASVEWSSEAPAADEDLIDAWRNPVLRVMSTLDPLANTQGWDSGVLAPANTYRRQFSHPGAYAYADGAGHSGMVIVEGSENTSLYLPFVER